MILLIGNLTSDEGGFGLTFIEVFGIFVILSFPALTFLGAYLDVLKRLETGFLILWIFGGIVGVVGILSPILGALMGSQTRISAYALILIPSLFALTTVGCTLKARAVGSGDVFAPDSKYRRSMKTESKLEFYFGLSAFLAALLQMVVSMSLYENDRRGVVVIINLIFFVAPSCLVAIGSYFMCSDKAVLDWF